MDVEEVVKYLRGKDKEKVLIMSGELCNKVHLGGKKLLDYAAEIAAKRGFSVAATGSTVKALKEKEGVKTKKMFAAEIPFYVKYGWKEGLSEKPEVIIMIGYDPDISRSIVTSLEGAGVDTVVLDNKEIKEATISLSDMSIGKWKGNLEVLIKNI